MRSRVLDAVRNVARPAARARARVVVLASGTGSLLAALLQAAAAPGYPADIVAVGSDRGCAALQRATDHGVPAFTVELNAFDARAQWDRALTAAVAGHDPELVVSAGFMKVLGSAFLARFSGRILNTHPALLPSFPGPHPVADALAHGVKVTGATVHLVDAGVDTGPILAQRPVPVLPDDDVTTLHERIKVVERQLLVDVVAAVATSGVITDGRKADIL